MLSRNPAFLGQVRLIPPGYRPPPPPPSAMGPCPAGQMPFTFADRTVCVDSGFYPVTAPGAEPGMVRPPGEPQIQPPIEMPPQPLNDIGPVEPPSVESRDDFYPYRTGQAPPPPGAEAAQGLPCPPGQYRPPGAGWCVPKPMQTGYNPYFRGNYGGFGGLVNMGPSGGVPFTMGRAMLGQVRLVRRPF
jgi:hypothetical protein